MFKNAASKKRTPYFKKRKTPAEMIRETSKSATMSEENPYPPPEATSSSSYESESSPAASDPGETWEGASSALEKSEQ